MADPIPAGPDEAANRARVQAIAQGGMQAAQQAPSIATAPEAMQTAMARSAGVNAPDLFNATQMATIQNPFTRGDAQLAADQAGAGGVLGSINSSTADYLQKASGGVDIQKEITRRTYQQLAQQHEMDAGQLDYQKQKLAYDLANLKASQDPNSLDYKIAQKEKEAKWAALNAKPLATSASSSKDVQSRTGETTATQKQITNQPWYLNRVKLTDGKGTADEERGIVDGVIYAGGDANMLRDSIAEDVAAGVKVWNDEIAAGNENPGSNPLALNPDNAAMTSAQIYAQYAPMFPNYQETTIGASNFAQAAFAGAGAPVGPAAAAPVAPAGVLVPTVPNIQQGAVERARAQAAPPAPYPMSVGPSLQQAALAQAHAQALPPGIAPTPQLPPATVTMTDADAEKLARAVADSKKKSSRGKSKRK